MTYRELYESAINKLDKSEITLGEFERMIKPLNAEVATDTNVGDKDTISRQAAIDGKICIQRANGVEIYDDYVVPVEYLKQLPPIQPEQLGTNLAEVGTDYISRQQAIKALSTITMYKGSIPYNTAVMRIEQLPSAQPQRTCVNCGRTVNNGGWYADGRTRCPIEEHYALPKDGYCHLWEKRNVTDDDYPERRTDE